MSVYCPSAKAWESTFYWPCDKLLAIPHHTHGHQNMPPNDKQNQCTHSWANTGPVIVLTMTHLHPKLSIIGTVFLVRMLPFFLPFVFPVCALLWIPPLQAENMINLIDSGTDGNVECQVWADKSDVDGIIFAYSRSTHSQNLQLGQWICSVRCVCSLCCRTVCHIHK